MTKPDPTPSPDRLSSVESWLESAQIDPSDPEQRLKLRVEIDAGLKLINDLLVVVKIELTAAENQRYLEDLYPIEDSLRRFTTIAREFGKWLDTTETTKDRSQYFQHELRTPLTVALGYAAVLLDQLSSQQLEDACKALEQINSEARRIVQIVVHLLSEH